MPSFTTKGKQDLTKVSINEMQQNISEINTILLKQQTKLENLEKIKQDEEEVKELSQEPVSSFHSVSESLTQTESSENEV